MGGLEQTIPTGVTAVKQLLHGCEREQAIIPPFTESKIFQRTSKGEQWNLWLLNLWFVDLFVISKYAAVRNYSVTCCFNHCRGVFIFWGPFSGLCCPTNSLRATDFRRSLAQGFWRLEGHTRQVRYSRIRWCSSQQVGPSTGSRHTWHLK